MQIKKQKLLVLRQIPFLLPLIILIAGIATAFIFEEKLSVKATTMATLLLVSAGLVFALLRSTNRWVLAAKNIGVLAGIYFLGISLLLLALPTKNPNWYAYGLKNAQAFEVEIITKPAIKEKTLKLEILVLKVQKNGKWKVCEGQALIYLYRSEVDTSFALGQKLIVPNEFQRIKNSGTPFAFRYADFLQTKGVYHQAFLSPESVFALSNLTAKSSTGIRDFIYDAIAKNVADTTTASLMKAILLNDRTELDKDLRTNYSSTGIAHIIAISGMHIGIFFAIIAFCFSWYRNKKYEWVLYALALPLIWTYITLAQFPPSAVRAGTMFTLYSIAIMIRRQANSLNVLLATGFLLLCYQPLWLRDVGFQLSFMAVLSILLFYKKIYRWYTPPNLAVKYFWQIIAVSISVQVLLFPIVIYYFHQLPMWSIIANIPAVIYSFLLLAGSLLLLALAALGIPALWLGTLLSWLTLAFNKIVAFFAHFTPSFLQRLYIDEWQVLIILAAVSLLALYLVSKKTNSLYGSLAFLSLLFIDLGIAALGRTQQQKIMVLQASNIDLIQNIKGTKSFALASERLSKNDSMYQLVPTQIGFGAAASTVHPATTQLFLTKGKRILYLAQPLLVSDQNFPIDVLIVGANTNFEPMQWQQQLHPKLVVLATSIKRYKSLKYQEELEEMGMRCHNVASDGAWVSE